MGTKDFFNKQKSQTKAYRGQYSGSFQQFTDEVESSAYITEYARDQFEFKPELDFSEPKNFAKFGLAESYYEDGIKKIYQQYPYDGSLAERLQFANDLNPLERYMFDHQYPRIVGYASFGSTYDGATTIDHPGASAGGFGLSNTPEYILFDSYTSGAIYDSDKNQLGSLQIDFASGSTVEFWLKKEEFPNTTTQTEKECLFYIQNTDATQRLYLHTSGGAVPDRTDEYATGSIYLKYYTADNSFNADATLTVQLDLRFDAELSGNSIADSKWHHYALVLTGSPDEKFQIDFYVDGKYKESQLGSTTGDATDKTLQITGTSIATLGALGSGSYFGSSYGGLGRGKLLGNLDNFRFWQTAKTAEEIGTTYFFDVGGGGNTDKVKVTDQKPLDLTVCYKFNEGATGEDEVDSVVLDYSGRLTNGVWVGYDSASRQSGSAIIDSETTTERGDPIIYSVHPEVKSFNDHMRLSGSSYDAINNSSLYSMMPMWIRDGDREASQQLKYILQIMGSYLDQLYGQISTITELKNPDYISGSEVKNIKANPYSQRNLTSLGFEIPDIFIDPGVLEAIFFKDEKRLYDEKLFQLKNLIFQNIYNNLTYINKVKGTEKSFRNLFRCFGVDNELVRLNIYADNQDYEITGTFEDSLVKRNCIDFSGFTDGANRGSIVFQNTASGQSVDSTGDYGYIFSSSNINIPITFEHEIFFPKNVTLPGTYLDDLPTASLFGVHTASIFHGAPAPDDPGDCHFKAYTHTTRDNKTRFIIKSSNDLLPELKSDFFENVYNNEKWNFAVRVKPTNYPFSSEVSSSDRTGFDYEFYGVNYNLGIKVNEFHVSESIDFNRAGLFLTGTNKKMYIGAERENFTGSLVTKSNVKFLSSRVWLDYLTNDEIAYHAKDATSFGRTNPYRNTFVFETGSNIHSNVTDVYIPKIESLALHWNFEDVTGSDTNGQFVVRDASSGSSKILYSPNDYSKLVGPTHYGRGEYFAASDTNAVDFIFVNSADQNLPENLYSSDLIKVLSTDDSFFNARKGSKPIKHYFSVETSMYDVISHEILGFFASINNFNDLIGNPVNKYRVDYKGLEKLREIFFRNVQNTPDLDKFVAVYHWLDGALDGILANLLPASAQASDKVRNIVESHVLERAKYRWKYNKIKDLSVEDRTGPPPGPPSPVPSGGIDLPFPIVNINYPRSQIPRSMEDINSKRFSRPPGLIPKGRSVGLHRPKFEDIRSPSPATGLDVGNYGDQSTGSMWWQARAERTGSEAILRSRRENDRTDIGVDDNRSRYQHFQYVRMTESICRVSELVVDAYRPLQIGTNFANDKNLARFKDSFNELKVDEDGLQLQVRGAQIDAPLNRSQNAPYYDYDSSSLDIASMGKRIVPLNVTDRKSSEVLRNQKDLPFTVISSSKISVYQEAISDDQGYDIDIVNIHNNSFPEASLQGPYTQRRVGGFQYRDKSSLLKTGADTAIGIPNYDRKEGYRINLNRLRVNNPRIVDGTYSTDYPVGTYFKEEVAQRPVNIKNISGSTYISGANYQVSYQMVQSLGRKTNNQYVVKGIGGWAAMPSNQSPSISWSVGKAVTNAPDPLHRYYDYLIPDRTGSAGTGSNKYIFVNKFSAPGGPETSTPGLGDILSSELSPYNALPWRNLLVREANNRLLARHNLSSAYDSHALGPTGAFYKNARNVSYKISASGELPQERPQAFEMLDTMFDNGFVNHGIPRSAVQYSWIRSSWLAQKTGFPNTGTLSRDGTKTAPFGLLTASGNPAVVGYPVAPVLEDGRGGIYDFADIYRPGVGASYNISSSDYSPIYGYSYNSNIRYVSGGHIRYNTQFKNGEPLLPTPVQQVASYFGYNNILAGHIDTGSNLFTSESFKSNFGDFYNTVGFDPGGAGADTGGEGTAQYILNALLLTNNGPYGYPTWKQIRGNEHRVTRRLVKDNLYQNVVEIYDDKPFGVQSQVDDGQWVGPEFNRSKTTKKTYRLNQSPVTIKHKPALTYIDGEKGTVKYSFGNNIHFYGIKYESGDEKNKDLNYEFNVSPVDLTKTDFYKFSEKFDSCFYFETLFPKDENVFRSIAHDRKNYVSFWVSNVLTSGAISAPLSQVPAVRIDHYHQNSQGYNISGSAWPTDVVSSSDPLRTSDYSGEIMRNTGSLGVFKYSAPSTGSEVNARYAFAWEDNRPHNLVQAQAGTGSFKTNYGEFSQDIQLIGQDQSLMPEFTLSDYVQSLVTSYKSDFTQNVYELALSGVKYDFDRKTFLQTYATTNEIQFLSELKEFYGEPTAIRLRFDVTKLLLPRDGFYPAQRTVQLAQQFSESYKNSTVFDGAFTDSTIPHGDQATFTTTLMPFWAPGIGYNSIKAGFAVEFPYKNTGSNTELRPAVDAYNPGRFSSYSSSAPFEAIITPSQYVGTIEHIGPSGAVTALNTWETITQINSTGSANRTDGAYELMASNFFGEVPEFFLESLNVLKAAPESQWKFEGPLSTSAGIKTFVMDVNINHPEGHIQYGGTQTFGPFPYNHHVPPGYYFGDGESHAATAPFINVSSTRSSWSRARITFDPTLISGSFPEKFATADFTFKDIMAHSTIEYTHMLGTIEGAEIGQNFMKHTASMKLFELDQGDRWTMYTKWECPVLNYNGATATHDGVHDAVKGVWHQYGELLGSNDAARINIQLDDSVVQTSNDIKTGSLAQAVGFSTRHTGIGKIKNRKVVEEAICVIPYYIDCETSEQKFFDIPLNIFEASYAKVRKDQVITDSISDVISKTDKYVLPPHYDFVHLRDRATEILTSQNDYDKEKVKPPFAMYIFEFSHLLNKQDLANIWQGVMPSASVEPEKEYATIEHPLSDGEVLSPTVFKYNGFRDGKMPETIKFNIFKIKKRAQTDYYRMLRNQTNVPQFNYVADERFSYNWPYDFFTFLEYGKMDVGLYVKNDSPSRYKTIAGGGYVKPEEEIEKRRRLGQPVVVDGADPCTDQDREELQTLINKSQTGASALGGNLGASSLTDEELRRSQVLVRKCGMPTGAPPRRSSPEEEIPERERLDEPLRSDEELDFTSPEQLCDDRTALNYNEPGPCRYEAADRLVDVPGCNDPTALNYDPGATIDDGSCEYLKCEDPTASNFGQKGECKYEVVRGCMDPDAVNYNPNATEDDPSQCLYEGAGGLPPGYSPDEAGMGNESAL